MRPQPARGEGSSVVREATASIVSIRLGNRGQKEVMGHEGEGGIRARM